MDLDKHFRSKLERTHHRMQRVIAMGNDVAKHFTKNNVEHLKVPHPSGLNRMWNNPELEPQVIEQIRGFTSQ